MAYPIAQLRVEANEHGDMLFLDFIHSDGTVYHSQAMPAHVSRESAQRIVEAMNNPEAVVIVDDFPPQRADRIQRSIPIQ